MRCARALLAATLALGACREQRSAGPAPVTSASSAAPLASGGRPAELRAAENRRDRGVVGEGDLQSPDPAIRRAAARALARIGGEGRAGLLRLLGDEDAEVVAFAAYGLGWSCQEHEEEHGRALIARALTLPDTLRAGPLDARESLVRALGRCGTAEAEPTLVAWLKHPLMRASAALALGDLSVRRPLKEDTLVALTQAASEGLGEAMYPFGRIDVSAAVSARVREVATQRLAVDEPMRFFAVRALGHCGEAAVPELGRVLTGNFRDAERAEAARALGRLGDAGQQALLEALPRLQPAPGPEGLAALVSDGFGVLAVALQELQPSRRSSGALAELARLPIPEPAAPRAIARRVLRLRCLAARVTAPRPESPALLGCDPSPQSPERDLARLAVLRREGTRGSVRLAVLRELVQSRDARVRSEALEALGAFKDVEGAAPLWIQALRSEHPGTVAAAARGLAARPEPGNDPLNAALKAALERPWKPDEVEPIAALLRALGAQRFEGGKGLLEKHCQGPSPTLRANAQAALALLGDRKIRCASGPPLAQAAPELLRAPAGQITLETDAGELTLHLEPGLAPAAAARLTDLVEAGFYNGMTVHRVVPGFVVQFGDRAGDGAGSAGLDPLRCETSPLPFRALSLGVAHEGRDTGSSQFFVTLAPTPHLDGSYTWLGTASGDWAALAEGDLIHKARASR